MKKFVSLVLALMLALSLVACGNGGSNAGTDADAPTNALELLTTAWNAYAGEKFAAVGGSAENSVNDAPGSFPVDDGDNLDYTLGFPADQAAQIDEAASLMHMMNSNTFTCGAYHLASGADAAALTAALKDNIMNRQWICGFPDKLVVITLGDYVVSMFGGEEQVNCFRDAITGSYASAQIACEEPIL